MTEVYLTRHLERVDIDNPSVTIARKWNSIDTKTYNFNPYLSDISSSEKLLETLANKTIKTIISSPFIRCVQTAIIVAKAKDIKVINIDYRLGEINDKFMIFYDGVYDPNIIWDQTQKYLNPEQNISFNIINDTYKGGEDEAPDGDETLYNKRMEGVLYDITQKNTHTLIVSHGHSLHFIDPKKFLAYAEVVPITSDMFTPKGDMGFASAVQRGGTSNIYIHNKNRYISLLDR